MLATIALLAAPVQESAEQGRRLLEVAQEHVLAHGLKIAAGLLVFVIGRRVATFLVNLLRRVTTQRKLDPTLIGFLCSVAYLGLLVLVIISALQTMGVETTSFVAVLGAATLAIGLALQGSLSNLAAGVVLILFRPFKHGDVVDVAGTGGKVLEIGIFATVLNTGDNKRVIVPNSAITGGIIVNYSANDTRRIDLVFGIGYGDDIKAAKAIMERVCREDPRILGDPVPEIGLLQLGESSVNFVCRPWVKTADYWQVLFALQERMKLEFEAQGITIPYPQRDVHLFQASA